MTSRSPRFRSVLATQLLLVAVASYAMLVPCCASWDGQLNILGYTTRPNYDTRFKTIRVKIFRNRTLWNLTPVPGLEMDLTRAVIREIEQKTPYKVVSGNADTELRGNLITFNKSILNWNQNNQIREAQTTMAVEIIWRALATGEVLTKAARRYGETRQPELKQPLLQTPGGIVPGSGRPTLTPQAPTADASGALAGGGTVEEEIIDPMTRKRAIPVVVQSVAEFRPELGESITTAMQKNMDRVAVQIVSVMETPW